MLIVAAALNPHLPAFSRKWRLVYPLNLNGEQNLAVWWSDIVLFTAALAATEESPPIKVCDCCVTIGYQRARFKYPVVRRFS